MWLVGDAVQVPPGVPGIWLLLITIVSTIGAVISTFITLRYTRSEKAGRDEISAAVSDAIEEYRTTFTEPLREENSGLRDENRRLRKQLADRDRRGRP